MSSARHEYVVDNNTLSRLTRAQRASSFFREHCHIPSEVLHEARGLPDIATLKANEYPTTAGVLKFLIDVMASVPVGDTKLVDLYANRGNADPLLIACALDGRRADNEFLFGPTWVVVSEDKAVRAKAEEFELKVMTNDEFVAVLEDGLPPADAESGLTIR
ncbi:hypothetical protein [Myceligenerans crystallogenes]|uniref:PIN domain-containing protein n=1 Tax=Myceligenerans crystallogenes TaxID=316335 RepID=A0ABN2NH04_9MICO